MDNLKAIRAELNEQAQALTVVACTIGLFQQTGDTDLIDLAQEGARRAIRSHARLVGLAQALRETGDDQV